MGSLVRKQGTARATPRKAVSNPPVAKPKPAAPKAAAPAKPGLLRRIRIFLAEVWAELHKAQWPSREELVKFTSVVLVFVILVAVYIGGMDTIFAWISNLLGMFGSSTPGQ